MRSIVGITRIDGRKSDELRGFKLTPGFQKHPAGSVLVEFGNTRVICAASIIEDVPPWMKRDGKQGGWLTAEYQMLPSSTNTRSRRERKSGPSGRTQEIQRLIGRSIRAAVDLERIGPRTIQIDCDVLDADGGTRCASITGGMVALRMAVDLLLESGDLDTDPIVARIAAVSVGIVDGEPILDLCYQEDSRADVDMNVVMTDAGKIIELQATAEGAVFSREELDAMLALAEKGVGELFVKS
ncbi:MAG: ribonuclease PH [Kiritimatiellaeota bacterium]|nr:ribonuclease PH [Kiritimatiellota bacterium]